MNYIGANEFDKILIDPVIIFIRSEYSNIL